MIEVRETSAEDIKAGKEWWFKKCGSDLPDWILPEFGVAVSVEKKTIFVGWMYVSHDSKMGFIAYVTANPDSDNKERLSAFKPFMNGFESVARRLNLKMLFITTNVASLGERIESTGFTKCDVDVVHYAKLIGEKYAPSSN